MTASCSSVTKDFRSPACAKSTCAVKKVALATFAALGLPPRIEYFDMPEHLRGKYQYFTQATTDRLRAAGFDQPFTELEEGVRRYVQDFLSQPDPYR